MPLNKETKPNQIKNHLLKTTTLKIFSKGVEKKYYWLTDIFEIKTIYEFGVIKKMLRQSYTLSEIQNWVISLIVNFSHQHCLVVFHLNLSDSKSPSKLLSMLSSGWSWFHLWFPVLLFLFKPLGTVPSAPTTIGITIILLFHCFLVLW